MAVWDKPLVRTGSLDDDGRVSERRADSAVPGSFSVDRRFRLWRYGVSHQTLMLRSTARFVGDDTIDVWFDGVAASNLHHSFQPLTIRAAETGERERMIEFARADLYDPVGRPPLCLVLASAGPDGYVVCAHARVELRGPAVVSARDDDPTPDESRILWFAGPTGDPGRPHEYRAVGDQEDRDL